MKTQLRDPDTGLSFTYEQEDGISLFRNPRTGEVRQDKAGARPPGWNGNRLRTFTPSCPFRSLNNPADRPSLTLSQRIAKELAQFTFLPGFKEVLQDLAARVEKLEQP